MRRRVLGRTGLEVSEISLGTVEIGMDYGLGSPHRPKESEAHLLLHGALDLGINFLDTARAYGESEAIIGRALSGKRNDFVLVSKVQVGTRDRMLALTYESLRQLRTDCIDILMLHSAPVEAIEDQGVRSVLSELKQQGAIRFTGVSVYGNDAALAAIRSDFYDCIQLAYSALDRRAEAVAVTAAARGVALIARSVLLKGALTDRSRLLPESLSPLLEGIDSLRQVASRASVSLPELSYRYVLGSGTVQSALVGASSLQEAEQAVAFANAGHLHPEQIAAIAGTHRVDDFYLNPGNWPS